MAQLMPLPLTASCSSQIQIGLTFLVPAHLGSPGQRAVKPVCVRVCMPIHTDSGSGIGRKGILAPFPQRLGILQQIFKHPSYVHIDAKLPHFIQLSLTFTAAAAADAAVMMMYRMPSCTTLLAHCVVHAQTRLHSNNSGGSA